jgi:hypothetical protein
LAVFELLRQKRQGRHGFLYASDLLELDGKDLKREPFEVRKATLASMLAKAAPGRRQNEHLAHEDGAIVFRKACNEAGGLRVEAEGFSLSLRALARLAQIDESGLRGGSARGGRGLVQLTCISVCLTDFRQGVFT